MASLAIRVRFWVTASRLPALGRVHRYTGSGLASALQWKVTFSPRLVTTDWGWLVITGGKRTLRLAADSVLPTSKWSKVVKNSKKWSKIENQKL